LNPQLLRFDVFFPICL